jgi:hypothetical protein
MNGNTDEPKGRPKELPLLQFIRRIRFSFRRFVVSALIASNSVSTPKWKKKAPLS